MGIYSSNMWSTADVIRRLDPMLPLDINARRCYEHTNEVTSSNRSTTGLSSTAHGSQPKGVRGVKRKLVPCPNMSNRSHGDDMHIGDSRISEAEGQTIDELLAGIVTVPDQPGVEINLRPFAVNQNTSVDVSSSTDSDDKEKLRARRRVCRVKLEPISGPWDSLDHKLKLRSVRTDKRQQDDLDGAIIHHNGRQSENFRVKPGNQRENHESSRAYSPSGAHYSTHRKRQLEKFSSAFDKAKSNSSVRATVQATPTGLSIFPYTCDQCTAHFQSADDYEKHVRLHLSVEPLAGKKHCLVNERAHQSERLMRSSIVHTPHACSYCSRRFGTLFKLNMHSRAHAGAGAKSSFLGKHLCVHKIEQPRVDSNPIVQRRNTNNSSVLKSAANCVCEHCNINCHSLAGLKSHLRSGKCLLAIVLK